ncbi:MAG: hypothetical protein ABF292_10770 [Desulfobacterales bacterium]
MKKMLGIKYLFALIGLMAAIAFIVVFTSNAAQPGTKKFDYPKAYEVFNQKCTGCHASVADPEKPGKTRDDWHLVVNVMHGHGLELSAEQSNMIIDLLYVLRTGMEKEAG